MAFTHHPFQLPPYAMRIYVKGARTRQTPVQCSVLGRGSISAEQSKRDVRNLVALRSLSVPPTPPGPLAVGTADSVPE